MAAAVAIWPQHWRYGLVKARISSISAFREWGAGGSALSDSMDAWSPSHTDCVLSAGEEELLGSGLALRCRTRCIWLQFTVTVVPRHGGNSCRSSHADSSLVGIERHGGVGHNTCHVARGWAVKESRRQSKNTLVISGTTKVFNLPLCFVCDRAAALSVAMLALSPSPGA